MWDWKRAPSKVWLVVPLLSLVLLAVACGSAAAPAATAAPKAAPKAAPQPAAPPTLVGVAAATPAPAPAAVATPTPKAAPIPAPLPAPAAQVHPGKLTIMVGDFGPERFDPAYLGGVTGTQNYQQTLGGYLISHNDKTELVPGIASQWSLSPNALTWTFTIRKGVKFHDGSDLTVQDVLWTLQHTFGPQAYEYATGSTPIRYSRGMDRIELSGPDQVSLTTKQPFFEFRAEVSETSQNLFPIMPKRAKLHDTEEEAAYDNNPIGAGSMRLERRVPAYVMKFERFGDFYYQPKNGLPEDKRVAFKSLDMFLVPEVATRVAAIRAGEADIVPASLETKKQVEAGGGRLVFGQEGVIVEARLIGCWEPKVPCRDKRVRQALDYAIDKELLRDRLFGGPQVFQIKGIPYVTPSTIGYTPELRPRPFDPNKARQLLAEAGYPGGKGFGKLLINTFPSTAMPFMVESAQLVAEFWRRELGLDAEVKVVDNTALKKRESGGELEGQVIWQDNEPRIDAESVMKSKYGSPLAERSSRPYSRDPEIARVVQETIQIRDLDKRGEAFKKLFPRVQEESNQLGIGYANIPWGVGPRVLTWRPNPLSVYPSALHTITLK